MAEPKTIDSLLEVGKTLDPPAGSRGALVKDDELSRRAEQNPEAFWAKMARELVAFPKPTHAKRPETKSKLKPWRTLRDAIGDVERKASSEVGHCAPPSRSRVRPMISHQ